MLIDRPCQLVIHGSVELILTRKCWLLVEYLSRHPHQPKSRNQISDAVHPHGQDIGYDRSIDGIVKLTRAQFRKAFDGEYRWIETRPGVGYLWQPDLSSIKSIKVIKSVREPAT